MIQVQRNRQNHHWQFDASGDRMKFVVSARVNVFGPACSYSRIITVSGTPTHDIHNRLSVASFIHVVSLSSSSSE
jgi:hypothetical protein